MSEKSERPLRIVKLGGSLLDISDLADRLRRWLAAQSSAENILVVGGGRLADVVRDYDRLHRLSESESHWLAIRAMELNARFAASLLPEAEWLDSLRQRAEINAHLAILDPWKFMQEDDRDGGSGRLPASWQVTSDTIAARAAELAQAFELVLLKSAPPPEAATIAAASAAGYVDGRFAETSRRLPCIRCVNLRDRPATNYLLAPSV